MAETDFDALDEQAGEASAEPMWAALVERLRGAKRYHELFEAISMQSRFRLGLSVVGDAPIDQLAEPVQAALEDAYLAGCREVGKLMLDEGQLREAWNYLRPAGEQAQMAEALHAVEPTDENVQEIIEIALYEGVDPAWGFTLVLEHYGTCNAITAFEGVLLARPKEEQAAAVGHLLGRIHGELLENVRADVARREETEPTETTLGALLAARPNLLDEDAYHIDTTHLNSVVRLARVATTESDLRLAYDLTEYGRRLGEMFQFPGEAPFEDAYVAHAHYYGALLGQDVEESVGFFREQAESIDIDQVGSAAAESYIMLLARLGRTQEAIDAVGSLFPKGMRTGGAAPSLYELSHQAGSFERMLRLCRQRDDLLGYAAALAATMTSGDKTRV